MNMNMHPWDAVLDGIMSATIQQRVCLTRQYSFGEGKHVFVPEQGNAYHNKISLTVPSVVVCFTNILQVCIGP